MEYNFSEIEKRWQLYWAEEKTFRALNPDDPEFGKRNFKGKYYVLDMFPYPSGAGLHVGHPLGYIASDIAARYKRHCGYNVLHPMGYDSFGLPAEQYAIQTGQHPAVTTEQNIKRYREQLDKIGFSFDWERQVKTSDPKYYKWTQWIFLKLFHSWYNTETDKAEPIETLIERFRNQKSRFIVDGVEKKWDELNEKEQSDVLMEYRLAYLSEAWVNWCPALGTVLANDEVKDGVSERGGHPVERKRMPQWSLRITAYAERLLKGLDTIDWSESIKEAQRNWIGRSEGSSLQFTIHDSRFSMEDDKLAIEVFTTRPDTVYGVNFLTLAPENDLVLQITTDEYRAKVEEYIHYAKNRSERERQTDVKKITGQFTGAYAIHPFTNEKIQVWVGEYVLAGYGTGAVMGVPAHDTRDYAFAKHFNLPIKKVIEPNDPVLANEECFDTYDGKCINSDLINGLEVKEAIKKIVAEIEKRGLGKGKVNYRLRDAIFGRQRYWGEPIPIYYENGIPKAVDEKDLPVKLPEVDKYLPTETGEPPLARAKNWYYKPSGNKANLKLEGKDSSHLKTDDINSANARLTQDDLNYSNYRLTPGPSPKERGEGTPSPEKPFYQTASDKSWAIKKQLAKEMRKNPTPAEEFLWNAVRNRNLGVKFRRQHPILDFIVDFVCFEKMLIIELDGEQHKHQKEDDIERTKQLENLGFKVVRFWNKELLDNPKKTFSKIKEIINQRPTVSDKYLAQISPLLWRGAGGEAKSALEAENLPGNTTTETDYFPLETTTMPGWAGSSWYFLRYMDAKNENEFASSKAIDYWQQVDLYIGGSEHATGHLLYFRFWTKFLKDLGYISIDEPAQKLINQGMIQGVSQKMYRSSGRGNTCVGGIFFDPERVNAAPIVLEGNQMSTFLFSSENIDNAIKQMRADGKTDNEIEAEVRQISSIKENVDINLVDKDGYLDIDAFIKQKPEHKDSVFICTGGYHYKGKFYPFRLGYFSGDERENIGSDKFKLVPEVEKMSKSKWNVVNPDDVISEYGADCLRMYEMFLGPLEQHKPWNTNGITGVFNFLKKMWRLYHLSPDLSSQSEADAKALKVLHRTIKKITEDIENYSFNTAVSAFMICVNELTDVKCTSKEVLEKLCILISPFAPHLAEELWQNKLGHVESVAYAGWPEYEEKFLVEDSYEYPVSINGKTRFKILLSLKLTKEEVEKSVLSSDEIKKYIQGSPKKVIVVPGRIVNVVV